MSKEELERQVREMMARQSKSRPMAQSEAARKAAEERVAKERERQRRLEAEERARQAEALKRRQEAEKALHSARNRPRTPRTPRTPPRTPRSPKPKVEEPVDPEAQRAAEARAKRRAASMDFLHASMRWDKMPPPGSAYGGTETSARGSPESRPNSARSPQSNPFGDLRTVRRAQTERILRDKPMHPSSYLPRYMANKSRSVAVVKL